MNKDLHSRRDTVKNRRMKAKRLLSTAHILVAVVALIESLLLIVFTTYSWIETSSSLIILNGTRTTHLETSMPITEALNYKYSIPPKADNQVNNSGDLNANFSYVKYYQMCRTSSPDGETFYFPTYKDGSQQFYRLGDTTDYNTSYIYFDVQVENNASTTQGFYFKNSAANIFSIGEGSTLTNEQRADVLRAMRISIQTDDDHPTIYSLNGTDDNNFPAPAAINSTTGDTYNATALKCSDFATSGDGGNKLFTVTAGSQVNVSFRVWLEMTDLFDRTDSTFYNKAANSTEMESLYSSEIKVNFDLAYDTTTSVRFYFYDYTFNSLGQHLTTLDNNKIMYFYNGKTQRFYPMTCSSTGSLNSPAVWVTANSSGTAAATIPESSLRSDVGDGSLLTDQGARYSYFVYANNNQKGSVPGSTVPTPYLYKWDLDNRTAPSFGTVSRYVFNGYSVSNPSQGVDNTTVGNALGDWANASTARMMQFVDYTTGYNQQPYNVATASYPNTGIVSSDANAHLYVYAPSSRKSIDSSNLGQTESYTHYNQSRYVASLFKDTDGYYKGYVPNTWLDGTGLASQVTPEIFYFSNASYSASSDSSNGVNYRMRWTASNPTMIGSSYLYSALGYADNSVFSSTAKRDGVGTWKQTAEVAFNSELIDTDLNSSNRYKVSFDEGTTFYDMVGNSLCNEFSAHVPDGYQLTFKRIDSSSNAVTWDGGTNRNYTNDPVYYATRISDSLGSGQWHVAVLADGTFNHMIYETVVNGYLVDGNRVYGTLEYSFDGVDYENFSGNMLDDYRWFVPDSMTYANGTVWYRWTPYSGTEFVFRHDIADGIYYVVVEGADSSYFQ